MFGRLNAQRDGEVGLARARRTEEHDVLRFGDEGARAQVRE